MKHLNEISMKHFLYRQFVKGKVSLCLTGGLAPVLTLTSLMSGLMSLVLWMSTMMLVMLSWLQLRRKEGGRRNKDLLLLRQGKLVLIVVEMFLEVWRVSLHQSERFCLLLCELSLEDAVTITISLGFRQLAGLDPRHGVRKLCGKTRQLGVRELGGISELGGETPQHGVHHLQTLLLTDEPPHDSVLGPVLRPAPGVRLSRHRHN